MTTASSAHNLSLERRWLGAILLLFGVIAVLQASSKLLWVDELITLAVAQQPGPAGIWNALRHGADPNPPLMHLLVQWSIAVFGVSGLAIRLPAIAGTLLTLVAMWGILRRWVTPIYAATGLLVFMATRGFDYAYEGRSYALLAGFSMASLWCWLSLDHGSKPKRALLLCGMILALIAGFSSNYYGVLAFFPLAIGEAFHRPFRLKVWIAFAIAAIPLWFYLPLIRTNIAEFVPHAFNRTDPTMILLAYLVLVEVIFWPVSLLALIAWLKRRRQSSTLPVAEWVPVAVLISYPFLGYMVAIGGAGMIGPRCVIPVCCGFGLAAALFAQRIFGTRKMPARLLVGFLLAWVLTRESLCATMLYHQRKAFFELRDRVATLAPEYDRVLLGDSAFALPLVQYSSEKVRQKVIFPIDFDLIHRYASEDSGEQNLWAGRDGVFPLRIVRYADFGTGNNIVLAPAGGWLLHALADAGYSCREVDGSENFRRVGSILSPLAHPESVIQSCTPHR